MFNRTFFLFAFVAHAEQWGLEYIYMTFPDQFREELKEEGYHQKTYVHAVHIGIGSNDNLVVTQFIQALLYIQGSLQKVELLVLIDHLLGKTKTVKGLTAQAEYGLGIYVTALGYGTAGRVTLGNENAALLLAVATGIVQVDAAVGQLSVVQIGLFGTLTGLLGYAGYLLALFLGFKIFLSITSATSGSL